MRISTSMQYNSHLSYLQTANSKVDAASNRYNTGMKFQTAGQDPSGMAAHIKYTSDIAAYQQYSINAGIVADTLSQEETALGQIWDGLSSIQTRLIQAVNGTMDDGARAALAEDIKQTQAQLFNLMNTKNSEGKFIFSGAASSKPTYTLTSDGQYVCQADGSNQFVLVAPNNKVQSTDSGLNIFENVQLAHSMTATPNNGIFTVSGIADYDQFNLLFKDQYSPVPSDNPNANKVFIQITQAEGEPAKFQLVTKDKEGKTTVLDEGTVKDGKVCVQGMEFTLADGFDPATGGPHEIEVTLNKPEQDNILNQLTDIINILSTPQSEWDKNGLSSSKVAQEISRMQQNVEIAKKNVDTYRGLVGARQANIDQIIKSDESLSDIKKAANANISEVDAFTAVSDLLQTQNALQVAQQSYQIVHSSSLFDFI